MAGLGVCLQVKPLGLDVGVREEKEETGRRKNRERSEETEVVFRGGGS